MRIISVCLGVLAAGSASAEPPLVVTDIAPVHSLVASVMGDLGAPVLLLAANADPHHMSLRPSQARALADADAVFWIGPSLTPWLEKPVNNLPEGAASVELAHLPETDLIQPTDGHDDHDAGHPTINPHVWLDPVNAAAWLDPIARTLSELDPPNRAVYEQNALAEAERIRRAADGIEGQLAPLSGARFLVTHDAFSYFGKRFGLQLSDTVLSGDAAAPSAARLARLRDDLAMFRCAFREPQQSASALETLLDGTAIPIAVLDPLGGNITPGPSQYRTLLARMAESIANCATDPQR